MKSRLDITVCHIFFTLNALYPGQFVYQRNPIVTGKTLV